MDHIKRTSNKTSIKRNKKDTYRIIFVAIIIVILAASIGYLILGHKASDTKSISASQYNVLVTNTQTISPTVSPTVKVLGVSNFKGKYLSTKVPSNYNINESFLSVAEVSLLSCASDVDGKQYLIGFNGDENNQNVLIKICKQKNVSIPLKEIAKTYYSSNDYHYYPGTYKYEDTLTQSTLWKAIGVTGRYQYTGDPVVGVQEREFGLYQKNGYLILVENNIINQFVGMEGPSNGTTDYNSIIGSINLNL